MIVECDFKAALVTSASPQNQNDQHRMQEMHPAEADSNDGPSTPYVNDGRHRY